MPFKRNLNSIQSSRLINQLQAMLGFDFAKAAELQRYTLDFEELGKIGCGGFSTVYRVKNKLDNRLYALKVIKIKPSLYKNDIHQHFQKMLTETKILAILSHPNIVRYYGCWMESSIKTQTQTKSEEQTKEPDSQFQLVMDDDESNSGIGFAHQPEEIQEIEVKKDHKPKAECLFNTSLNDINQINIYIQTELCEHSLQWYIEQRNILVKDNNLRKYFRQNYFICLDIIKGLKYIHSKKIIHRDLKLQNIIMDKTGMCKIIDFGLAKRVRNMSLANVDLCSNVAHLQLNDQELQKYSSSVGTKIFSSPEQSSSNKYDHRTDIYSLAMIIAIMFCHFTTVHGERQILMDIRSKKLEEIDMQKPLRELLVKCLSQEKLRPSLQELQNCIKKLVRQDMEKSGDRRCSFQQIKQEPQKLNQPDKCK